MPECKHIGLTFFFFRVTCVDEGETVIKTASDYWVVGKKSDQREFYVVLNNKMANLAEINGMLTIYSLLPLLNFAIPHVIQPPLSCSCVSVLFVDEVKKLCTSQFSNIFFLD